MARASAATPTQEAQRCPCSDVPSCYGTMARASAATIKYLSVPCRDIGTVLQQGLHNRSVPALRGSVQTGSSAIALLLLCCFDIRAELQKKAHCREMPRLTRQNQGLVVDLGLEVCEQLHKVIATQLGGHQQRPLPACTATAPESQNARGEELVDATPCSVLTRG